MAILWNPLLVAPKFTTSGLWRFWPIFGQKLMKNAKNRKLWILVLPEVDFTKKPSLDYFSVIFGVFEQFLANHIYYYSVVVVLYVFCFLAGLLLKNLESFNNQYNISRDPIGTKFYLFNKYFFKIWSHFLLILYKYSESTYSIVNINNHVRNRCNRGGAYICVCVCCVFYGYW